MAEVRPTMEERDRYLDELVSAFAQGRVDAWEFSRRSEQIMGGDTRRELNEALNGIRSDLQPQIVATEYQPRPYRPVESSGQPPYLAPPTYGRRINMRRRQMFIVGGMVAFAGVFGVGLLGVLGRKPSQGPAYPPAAHPQPNPVEGYLGEDLDQWLPQSWLSGAISSVTITRDTITAVVKPVGERWQKVVIDKQGSAVPAPAGPGTNIFDYTEANVTVLSEAVERSAELLKDEVASVKFARPTPDTRVIMTVTGLKGGTVTWDALNRTVEKVAQPK